MEKINYINMKKKPGVEQSIDKILNFISEIPLSQHTIKDYGRTLRFINKYCNKNDLSQFGIRENEIFLKHMEHKYNRGDFGIRRLSLLRKSSYILKEYMENDVLNWDRISFQPRKLNNNFLNLLSDFKDNISKSFSPSTVNTIISKSNQLLLFLQSQGLLDIMQLSAEHIKNFFQFAYPKNSKSKNNLRNSIDKFISFLNDTKSTKIDAKKYLAKPAPTTRKLLPCFTNQEIDLILSKIDTTSKIGKRDYAIITLAIHTGLRSIDILKLKLDDIDWKKSEITICQSKTKNFLLLPLMSEIGDALCDYILNARPESDSRYIFLTPLKPHKEITNFSFPNNILKKYLKNAGIHHKAWDGKSFHAFRRSTATRLIEAEVPLTTVMEILGHKKIDSTKRYISYDKNRLKSCCLDISHYSTMKKGLE
jgi:site-specific recombinase XerD